MSPQDEALKALAGMCKQYLSRSDDELDHQCMGAGERAVGVLVHQGLVEPCGRGGVWTAKGIALLDAL